MSLFQKIAKLVGGVAVNKSTYAPGFNTGEQAVLALDQTSGRLLVDSVAPTATGALAQQVQGAGASGSSATGNPVLIGGYSNADGTARTFLANTNGGTYAVPALYWSSACTASDGTSNIGLMSYYGGTLPGQNIGSTVANGLIYAQRGNDPATLQASSAQTTTQTLADQTNFNGRGVVVFVNVTAAGTGSITTSIQGKDPLSGAYYTILTGAAVTTNGLQVLRAYPGISAAANVSANDVLPRTWRVVVTANNANSMTYSVSSTTLV